jgi:hypothetical protein
MEVVTVFGTTPVLVAVQGTYLDHAYLMEARPQDGGDPPYLELVRSPVAQRLAQRLFDRFRFQDNFSDVLDLLYHDLSGSEVPWHLDIEEVYSAFLERHGLN